MHRFETSDGQKREEHAQTVVENDESHQVVSGSYAFVDPETQKQYTVYYTADKDGFHATGEHLPKAPEPLAMPMAKKTLNWCCKWNWIELKWFYYQERKIKICIFIFFEYS